MTKSSKTTFQQEKKKKTTITQEEVSEHIKKADKIRLKQIHKEGNFTEGEAQEVCKKFRSCKLLNMTLTELSKDHLRDDKEKLTAFFIALTSKLRPDSLHKSIAFLGDSSVGKDNLMKTILKHIPEDEYVFLTSGTQSVMEDDIQNFNIVAFSEFNIKEGGANVHLVEIIKQMAEGGTSAFKKDVNTGYKIAKHIKQEQKTVLYSTVQEKRDDELETRFITATIKGHPVKTKAVNINTLDWFGNIKKQRLNEKPNWIKIGLKLLKHNRVIIPFAPLLINIFDHSDPRSQRDVKRFMAIISAIAYYHQLQRPIINGVVIAYRIDCINAFQISKGFFNLSYKGIDGRLKEILDVMDEYVKDNPMIDPIGAVPRIYIQERTGIKHKDTIRKRMTMLQNMNLIKWIENRNNIPYYQRYQKGIKSPLIRCHLKELIELLTDNTSKKLIPLIHPFDILKTSQILEFDKKKRNGVKGVKNKKHTLKQKKKEITVLSENLTPSKLTPSEEIVYSDDDLLVFIKEKGKKGYPSDKFAEKYGDDNIKRLLKKGDIVEMPKGYLRILE